MAKRKPRELAELLALPDEAALSEREAGIYLRRSLSSMRKLRREGGGPVYFRVGCGLPEYIKGDLKAYRERRRYRNAAHELDEIAKRQHAA
jgi:hypothetical protein